MNNFERSLVPLPVKEFERRQPVFQVLTGPRQVGKTTIARQVMEKLPFPSVYASAATGYFGSALTPSVGIFHVGSISAGIPAQVLSYNKMLGQLQDAGNTTTLAQRGLDKAGFIDKRRMREYDVLCLEPDGSVPRCCRLSDNRIY